MNALLSTLDIQRKIFCKSPINRRTRSEIFGIEHGQSLERLGTGGASGEEPGAVDGVVEGWFTEGPSASRAPSEQLCRGG